MDWRSDPDLRPVEVVVCTTAGTFVGHTIESKRPDGTREKFNGEKDTYYSLVPEYSRDGSHLNDYGSQRAAKELILLLGRLISEMERMK